MSRLMPPNEPFMFKCCGCDSLGINEGTVERGVDIVFRMRVSMEYESPSPAVISLSRPMALCCLPSSCFFSLSCLNTGKKAPKICLQKRITELPGLCREKAAPMPHMEKYIYIFLFFRGLQKSTNFYIPFS